MSDIFISYSRKDSEQALQLAERLRNDGIDVWIDQRGIEAATSWSKEIVHAIDGCKAFLVLLSASSLSSKNVAKELGIASEAEKPLLPVALEDIKLSDEFRYHLSGIQRVAYTQHDAITSALAGFGIIATKAAAKKDERKSLMILPFEDLSPTQDNGWFADGLVSEMIGKLSVIKSLKLIDRQTSLQTKKKGHSIGDLAKILEVRYFIEGSIRKFGEQIKIDAALLDFETGDYLWQDTHKGVFADIFDMQELIADKVVAGLKLHLGSDEKQAFEKKLTVNPEAYEFYLKGGEEYQKTTREGFERAIVLLSEAVKLDPEFTVAYAEIANAHLGVYIAYDRSSSHLDSAEGAIEEVRRIEGESKRWCWIMSRLERVKGDYLEAERYARQGIKLDPEYSAGYDALGSALSGQNRFEEAVEARTELVRRKPFTSGYFNLLLALGELRDMERMRSTSLEALPVFEKHLKLNPEDLHTAVNYAAVLYDAGKRDEASALAHEFMGSRAIDGVGLYNLACLMCSLNENGNAIEALSRSIGRGFSNIELLRRDPDFNPIRELPEFKAIIADLEASIAAQQTSPNEDKSA